MEIKGWGMRDSDFVLYKNIMIIGSFFGGALLKYKNTKRCRADDLDDLI